jgi:hypothetical protein
MTDEDNTGNEGTTQFDFESWERFQKAINPSILEDNFATNNFYKVYDPSKSLPLTYTEAIKRSLGNQ